MDAAAAAALLDGASEVTLLGHVRPDADAVGSALALGGALAGRGARVQVSFPGQDAVPESLRGLDSAGLLVPPEQTTADGVLVALDCSSADRLGSFAAAADEVRARDGVLLVVDHHPGNTRFGTHHFVDESAEATAVLVAAILAELGVALDTPVARCLYAGLATDTSWFRRASPATHELAARLLAAGVDPARCAYELMDSHPFGYLDVLGTMLRRARLDRDAAGGKGLVSTSIELAQFEHIRPEDAEKAIDILRGTLEADVAMVAKELRSGEWTVSLRSRTVHVGSVAARLGGGGHRMAAGCSVTGSAADVYHAVCAALDDAKNA